MALNMNSDVLPVLQSLTASEQHEPDDRNVSVKHDSSSSIDSLNSTDIGHYAKKLSEEEIAKLVRDKCQVSDFKQKKLEKEAQKNWDLFYKRNTTKFFKDRHWTTREFQELCDYESRSEKLQILEVGCGVGNFIFPLLKELDNAFFYACDFSPRAIEFVKENPVYSEERCHAFQCDITADPLLPLLGSPKVDIITLVFVLSAIHPDKMPLAVCNLFSVLRPGGCVLFRDYGLYDHAMLRFAPGHKLTDNFYVRQDGTRAFYFSEETIAALFVDAGFEVTSNSYIVRETTNRKEGLCVQRVFVQAKFTKPPTVLVEHSGGSDTYGVTKLLNQTPQLDTSSTNDS